jgi:hypothetical protein
MLIVVVGTVAYLAQLSGDVVDTNTLTKTSEAVEEAPEAVKVPSAELSREARAILKEKLKEQEGMIEYRIEEIARVKAEIDTYQQLLDSLPKDSQLYGKLEYKLKRAKHKLEGLIERNVESRKEVAIYKSLLGGD